MAVPIAVLIGGAAAADEGMWLFDQPPTAKIERDHAARLGGAKLTAAWLGHLQQASVRFNSGGSGAFVSADGLVLTNHHVAADARSNTSTIDAHHSPSRAPGARR
jgi:S1-C subfamily serine protease